MLVLQLYNKFTSAEDPVDIYIPSENSNVAGWKIPMGTSSNNGWGIFQATIYGCWASLF